VSICFSNKHPPDRSLYFLWRIS